MSEEREPERLPPLREITRSERSKSTEVSDAVSARLGAIEQNLNAKQQTLRKDLNAKIDSEIGTLRDHQEKLDGEFGDLRDHQEKLDGEFGTLRTNQEKIEADFRGELQASVQALEERSSENQIEFKNAIDERIEASTVVLQSRQDTIQQENEAEQGRITERVDSIEHDVVNMANQVQGMMDEVKAMTVAFESFKDEINAEVKRIRTLVAGFDSTLFANDIRAAFSSQLLAAETKAAELDRQLEASKEEFNSLQRVLIQKQEELNRLQKKLGGTRQSKPAVLSEQELLGKPVDLDVTPAEVTSPNSQEKSSAEQVGKYCRECGAARMGPGQKFCIKCGAVF